MTKPCPTPQELTFSEIIEKLGEPFPGELVKWRVGATTKDKKRGLALAYIDARDVMNRLDAVVGAANWSTEMVAAGEGRVLCSLAIKCYTTPEIWHWVRKTDGADPTSVEPMKGAASDALKRAGVQWNIARYLYAIESPWVEIEPFGKSYKIKDSEHARLARIAAGEKVEAGAPPASPPDKSPARFLSKEEAKELWKANFKALELFHTKEEIEAFDQQRKFQPINFACGRMGVNRVDELYKDQLDGALEAMREWVREKRARDEADTPKNAFGDEGYDPRDDMSPGLEGDD